jgi:hypothetical protein
MEKLKKYTFTIKTSGCNGYKFAGGAYTRTQYKYMEYEENLRQEMKQKDNSEEHCTPSFV